MPREYRRENRTPEKAAEVRAVRERYQRDKPSLEEALAESGQAQPQTLGEVLFQHAVAALLKAEREKQGVTLADLEARTGIDQGALSRLENGKTNATLGTVDRVSRALGKAVVCALRDA